MMSIAKEDKEIHVAIDQYHGWLCYGDALVLGIINHGIGLVFKLHAASTGLKTVRTSTKNLTKW